MKTYYNILKSASLLAMMSLTMASCNDWLTVHPQTQIVEENFWEDKNDLEGVRYGAYKNMAGQVEKMAIWGDLRSDIYQIRTLRTSDQTYRDDFANIRQANIDTTLAYYDWSPMYTTIGYCNKVLQHGPDILEKDKQFTSAEWRQMEAEMVTMRALSYFYLVRAFKSIPYTTKVVNTDADVEYFPQLPAIDVMDSLITDVERVAGHARNRFVNKSDTKGMITNTAIYALLSDMYLWRASMLQGRDSVSMAASDYRKCIENSELSIAKLQEQFEEETKGSTMNKDSYIEWSGAPRFAGKDVKFMYKNNIRNASRGIIFLTAFEEIFKTMNSYESIFELQFSVSDGRRNSFPIDIWGTGNSATLVSTITENSKSDMRYWINGWSDILGASSTASDFYVLKWCAYETPVITEGVGTKNATVEMSLSEEDRYHNWIVWRLSDMLLNNAEARACLVKMGQGTSEDTDICNKLLRMVNRRWWVDLSREENTDIFDLSASADYDIEGNDLIEKVMNTRKLEFVGEGKRWFDLVRWAERNSSSDDDAEGMRAMFDSFMNVTNGYETARNRCENLWGLYCPIYYLECKAYRANGAVLNQNPVWNKSKYDRK